MEVEIGYISDLLDSKIPETSKITSIFNITNPEFFADEYFSKVSKKFPYLNRISVNFDELQYKKFIEKNGRVSPKFVDTIVINSDFIPYDVILCTKLVIGNNGIINIDAGKLSTNYPDIMLILPDYFAGRFSNIEYTNNLQIGVSANFVNWANVPKCRKIQFIGCSVSLYQINNAYSTGCKLVFGVNGKFLKPTESIFSYKRAMRAYVASFLFLGGLILGAKLQHNGYKIVIW